MKKTLVSLAIVSCALISENVIASGWERSGSGGTVEFGGTLIPDNNNESTPWKVKVGDAVNGLDAKVQKGESIVFIKTEKPILFLGISTAAGSDGFTGREGIAPQIDYNGAVSLDEFGSGQTRVTIPVRDKNQTEIGFIESLFSAVGMQQWKKEEEGGRSHIVRRELFAFLPGHAFYGGAPKSWDGCVPARMLLQTLDSLDPEIAKDAWPNDSLTYTEYDSFANGSYKYQGYYGGGIKAGTTIRLNLNTAIGSDEPLEWHASLPVVVSYR
ncbi:F4 family fimbrial subunit [Escherichia coli]|uniref:F4 family fimbrial subunit n=1 Tax=Escherichia coli TaxID=562 RepID=UPI0010CB30B2|nr:hypothetical protein [Escherichia coli]GCR40585.1 fimbrial protein FaeI [Escherichia coli]